MWVGFLPQSFGSWAQRSAEFLFRLWRWLVECLSDFVRLAVDIGAAHLMLRRLAPVEVGGWVRWVG